MVPRTAGRVKWPHAESGAGFGRTGTASLGAALEELGFGPSSSLSEIFANPEHDRVLGWQPAAHRDELDRKGFLDGLRGGMTGPPAGSTKSSWKRSPRHL